MERKRSRSNGHSQEKPTSSRFELTLLVLRLPLSIGDKGSLSYILTIKLAFLEKSHNRGSILPPIWMESTEGRKEKTIQQAKKEKAIFPGFEVTL